MYMAKKKIKLEGPIEESNQSLGSSGFGDTIKSITSALGIEQCEPCKERQEMLNKLFPYLKASREVTIVDKRFMDKITSSHIIQNDDVNELFRLYNELFTQKLKRCNCPGLIAKMIERLKAFIY